MSKMRLNPATIGVVRSCAIPQAVKQQMSAINTTTMPLPISGWLRVASGCATTTGLPMLLNGVTLLSRRAHLFNALLPTKVRHVNPRSAISDDALRSATFGRLHLIGRSIPRAIAATDVVGQLESRRNFDRRQSSARRGDCVLTRKTGVSQRWARL